MLGPAAPGDPGDSDALARTVLALGDSRPSYVRALTDELTLMREHGGPGSGDAISALAALMGVGATGIQGRGTVATVRFEALASGPPVISIERVSGRDAGNRDVDVAIQSPLAVHDVPKATELLPAVPNPTRGSTLLLYSLASRSRVSLAVYSVDGRRVKTIAQGVQEAGRYQFTWNGVDERGAVMKSGVFYVRLDAGGTKQTRVLMVIR